MICHRALPILLLAALAGCDDPTGASPFVNLGGVYGAVLPSDVSGQVEFRLELHDVASDPAQWDIGALHIRRGDGLHFVLTEEEWAVDYRATADSVLFRWHGAAQLADASRDVDHIATHGTVDGTAVDVMLVTEGR